jgi:integrase
LRAVAIRGNSTQPRRVFEVIRAMLTFANKRGIISGTPWKQVTFEFPQRSEVRSRTLSAADIRWLWALTESWAHQPNLQRAARLILLLGQRSNEVCGIEHAEISSDGRTWTIPAARTKNKTTQRVRLPPMARQILADAIAALPSKRHVFVGARGRPLRADNLLHTRAEAIEAHNKEAALDKQIEPFVVHDFRRTVASGLEILGVPANVISTGLNHISAKKASVTGKHYLHGDLTRYVQAVLTEWQGTLEAIIAGGDPLTAMKTSKRWRLGCWRKVREASHIFALYRSAPTGIRNERPMSVVDRLADSSQSSHHVLDGPQADIEFADEWAISRRLALWRPATCRSLLFHHLMVDQLKSIG